MRCRTEKQKSPNKATGNQRRKFVEKARDIECDEDEAAFEEKPATIAGRKPKPEKDEAPDD